MNVWLFDTKEILQYSNSQFSLLEQFRIYTLFNFSSRYIDDSKIVIS